MLRVSHLRRPAALLRHSPATSLTSTNYLTSTSRQRRCLSSSTSGDAAEAADKARQKVVATEQQAARAGNKMANQAQGVINQAADSVKQTADSVKQGVGADTMNKAAGAFNQAKESVKQTLNSPTGQRAANVATSYASTGSGYSSSSGADAGSGSNIRRAVLFGLFVVAPLTLFGQLSVDPKSRQGLKEKAPSVYGMLENFLPAEHGHDKHPNVVAVGQSIGVAEAKLEVATQHAYQKVAGVVSSKAKEADQAIDEKAPKEVVDKKEQFKKRMSDARQKTEDFMKESKQKAEQAVNGNDNKVDQAKDQANKASQKASDKAEDVKQSAKGMMQSAKDKVNNAVDTAKEKTGLGSSNSSKPSGASGNKSSEQKANVSAESRKQTGSGGSGGGSKPADASTNRSIDSKEKARALMQRVKQLTDEKSAQYTKQASNEVAESSRKQTGSQSTGDKAKQQASNVSDKASEKADEAKQRASGLLQSAKEKVSGAVESAKQKTGLDNSETGTELGYTAARIKSAVKTGVDSLERKVEQAGSGVMHTFDGAKSKQEGRHTGMLPGFSGASGKPQSEEGEDDQQQQKVQKVNTPKGTAEGVETDPNELLTMYAKKYLNEDEKKEARANAAKTQEKLSQYSAILRRKADKDEAEQQDDAKGGDDEKEDGGDDDGEAPPKFDKDPAAAMKYDTQHEQRRKGDKLLTQMTSAAPEQHHSNLDEYLRLYGDGGHGKHKRTIPSAPGEDWATTQLEDAKNALRGVIEDEKKGGIGAKKDGKQDDKKDDDDDDSKGKGGSSGGAGAGSGGDGKDSGPESYRKDRKKGAASAAREAIQDIANQISDFHTRLLALGSTDKQKNVALHRLHQLQQEYEQRLNQAIAQKDAELQQQLSTTLDNTSDHIEAKYDETVHKLAATTREAATQERQHFYVQQLQSALDEQSEQYGIEFDQAMNSQKQQLQQALQQESDERSAELQKLAERVHSFRDIFQKQAEYDFVSRRVHALALSLLSLEALLSETGSGPFVHEWNTVKRAGEGDALIETAISSVPQSTIYEGVMSSDELRRSFDLLDEQSQSTAFVSSATPQSPAQDQQSASQQSVWTYLLARGAALLNVRERQIVGGGSDVDRLQRAQYWLHQKDDLHSTVRELENLSSPELKQKWNDYVHHAKQRMTLQQAVDVIRSRVSALSMAFSQHPTLQGMEDKHANQPSSASQPAAA